jgi:hypothetical protein
MKTRSGVILKSLADLPGAVRSLGGDGTLDGNGPAQPDSAAPPSSAAPRAAAGAPPTFLLAWSELGAARQLAAWRRGGINE